MSAAFIPVFILLAVGILVSMIIISAAFSKRMLHKISDDSSGPEAMLLQKMNAQLDRLEKRIETLETIIIETGKE